MKELILTTFSILIFTSTSAARISAEILVKPLMPLDSLPKTDSTKAAKKDSINAKARSEKDLAKNLNYGQSIIQFVGDGNLQKSLNQGTGFAANTGLGVLFTRVWNKEEILHSLHIDFFVNVASTADTIISLVDDQSKVTNQRYFGNYVLLPQNSRQASEFNMDLYFGEIYNRKKFSRFVRQIPSGISIKFLGSNSNWVYNGENINLSAMSLKYGIFHEWVGDDDLRFNNEYGGHEYSITLGLYYSHRFLAGDLSFKEYEDKRIAFLGNNTNHYRGLEIGLAVRLKNIKAEVAIPFLRGGRNKNSVPGLTNTQFITSISFVGGFPIDLGKKKTP